MSRRSRSQAGMSIWLQFGATPPTVRDLSAMEDEIRQVIEAYGLRIYALESWVKDDHVRGDER